MSLRASLVRLRACGDAREWVGNRDLATAWRECRRGDWMLWLAAHVAVDRRVIVQAACDCAEQAAPHWTPDTQLACAWAIDAARRWAIGETDLDEVRAAADAAAYAAAAYAAAAYAAAAYAAYAAGAADAAAYAADAADAAAYAADARGASLSLSADLVRARIQLALVEAAMAAREAA